ncbi:MAG: ATP-binding protein [Elsteraceae bacterium]
MISLKAQIAALETELADCKRQLRKVTERAAAKEAQLRLMLEAAPVAIANLASDGGVLEANSAYRRLMSALRDGEQRSLAAGISVAHVDRRARIDGEDADRLVGRPQGKTMAAPDGSLVVVSGDVEGDRLTEEGLRGVIELIPAVVAVFDGEFRLAAFNQQLVDHFRADLRDRVRVGASLAEMATLLMKSVVWFEGGSFGGAPYGQMSDEEIEAYVRERAPLSIARRGSALNEYETRDGRIYQSRTNAFLGGGIVRVGIDVTEERLNKQRVTEMVSSLTDGVLLFDSDLKLRLWSPSVGRMFDFLGPMMIEGASANDIRAAMREAALKNDHAARRDAEEAFGHRRYPDGRVIHFREVETREGGLLVTCSDQTDLCRALALASRVERMESLGRLVAGVAHEIGTPLGVAVTAGSIVSEQAGAALTHLRLMAKPDPEMLDCLEALNDASSLLSKGMERAVDLVDSFKRVSLDELTDDYRSFRLAAILSDVAVMLRPQLRAQGHDLVIDCPDEITLSSYPGAISQIIANLVSNSILHGYPGGRSGGRLYVAARLRGEQVEIDCGDDGVGVTSEVLARIFEHFFTTRRGAGASGLGLGVVHNLVTNLLGGSVEAKSAPGEGLRILIRIPMVLERDASVRSGDLAWVSLSLARLS